MELEAHCSKDHQLALKFNDLFKIDAMAPEFDEAKIFIHECRAIKWPPFLYDFKSEKDVLLAIAAEILIHISPEVTMEKRYSRVIADHPKISLQTSSLGMGHH